MTSPTSFPSTTARHQLPLLFTGQAQKELTFNQAVSLVDALLHPVVEGTADAPPSSPVEGECWLIGASPSGDWAGASDALACFASSVWLIIAPREGLSVHDRTAGQEYRFDGTSWSAADPVVSPSGGSVVDVEARTAIDGLLAAMQHSGTLP